MTRKIFFCVPAQAAAIIANLTVLLTFGVGAATGWYALYGQPETPIIKGSMLTSVIALGNLAEYHSKPMRTKLFAGLLGAFSSMVFAVSSFGYFNRLVHNLITSSCHTACLQSSQTEGQQSDVSSGQPG
jgi:hypothetical protein